MEGGQAEKKEDGGERGRKRNVLLRLGPSLAQQFTRIRKKKGRGTNKTAPLSHRADCFAIPKVKFGDMYLKRMERERSPIIIWGFSSTVLEKGKEGEDRRTPLEKPFQLLMRSG